MRGEAQAPATRLPQSGLAGCSGASHCSNCWPRVAFDSAASLLRGIEELNGSDGVDVCKSASQSKDSRQQQPKEEDKASVCPRACAGLALEALELLVDILRIFGPERILLSFNGGKDAVAILHLFRAALVKYTLLLQQEQHKEQPQQHQQQQKQSQQQHKDTKQEHLQHQHLCNGGLSEHPALVRTCGCFLPRPRAIYFHSGPQEFPEVAAFVRRTAEEFFVNVEVYYSDWASGLRSFLSQRPHTPFAFVLGTRNTDPQGLTESLQFLQPSSRWLPPFLRVQPLLKFGYGHVWDFLRYFKLPYCCLYDQGYSSIGTMENTRPNPLLIPSDGGAALPAYELLSWEREREGRFKKQRKESKTVAVS
ncbi:probable FAD synthase [Cyclospora cayetanensis]|uniref:FAD synthase n=1 Tax=Cyclospora cayetanensis TaxID=88456 RepID=A0A6P6RWS9_9EIME|nr:probable FAD synthase [Cyclospora cayetanensis]